MGTEGLWLKRAFQVLACRLGSECCVVLCLRVWSVYLAVQALATLETCVKQRWKVLPPDQREAIKAYIVNVIVRCEHLLVSRIPALF